MLEKDFLFTSAYPAILLEASPTVADKASIGVYAVSVDVTVVSTSGTLVNIYSRMDTELVVVILLS